jgi:hypothetical protein
LSTTYYSLWASTLSTPKVLAPSSSGSGAALISGMIYDAMKYVDILLADATNSKLGHHSKLEAINVNVW